MPRWFVDIIRKRAEHIAQGRTLSQGQAPAPPLAPPSSFQAGISRP
jgi:hypothetical protein